jgi:hypothetical protein
MFQAVQQGKVPETMPDGISPYEPEEGGMAPGTKLATKGVLLYCKGDWSEFTHSLGLSSWQSKFSPCAFCDLTAEDIASRGHELCSPCPEWTLRTVEGYQDARSRCEVTLDLKHQRQLQDLCKIL